MAARDLRTVVQEHLTGLTGKTLLERLVQAGLDADEAEAALLKLLAARIPMDTQAYSVGLCDGLLIRMQLQRRTTVA